MTAYESIHWGQLNGGGQDLGVGADGSIWVVGGKPGNGNSSIFKRDGETWSQPDRGAGKGVRIAVHPDGTPWVCNANGGIFYYKNGAWNGVGGSAQDIGIGGDGSVWIIGGKPGDGNYSIFRWNGRAWDQPDRGAGKGVRIAVQPDGTPWMCNANGAIFYYTSGKWNGVDGSAQDIGIGGDGSVWIIGGKPGYGNYSLFYRSAGGWRQPDQGSGKGVCVSVDQLGRPLIVNAAGSLFIGKPVDVVEPHKIRIHSIRCIIPSTGTPNNGWIRAVEVAVGTALGTVVTAAMIVIGAAEITTVTVGTLGTFTIPAFFLTTGGIVAASAGVFVASEMLAVGLGEGIRAASTSIGQSFPDQVYINVNGKRYWPAKGTVELTAGSSSWIDIPLPRVDGKKYLIEVFDADITNPDDVVGQLEISPGEVMTYQVSVLTNAEEESVYALIVSATDSRNSDQIIADWKAEQAGTSAA